MRRRQRRADRRWEVGLVLVLLGWGVMVPGRTGLARVPEEVESGEVVLRVVGPRIHSIQDGSRLFVGGGEEDPNGYGRPGARGFILISGVGLSGATGIEFEGRGVRGEVVSAGRAGELNPAVLVRVTIEPTAELGPRAFTLLTPRGPVRSEGVAFIVTEPKILALGDEEGSPGSSGRVEVFGIGLDGAQAIEFEGTGISGTIVPSEGGFEFLNPVVEVDLRIAEEAAFGERGFIVETPHARLGSGAVRFRVVAPRIDGVWEGHNFRPDQGFRMSGEGARDSFGDVLIVGIGLGGALDVAFSGSGIEARLMPGFPEQMQELNPVLTVHVTIAADAPLGERGILVTIPRVPGRVDSRDTGITFTVIEPRIDGIADRRGFNEAVAGACGEVEVRGVGLREATAITFAGPGGVRGIIRPEASSTPLLNSPARVWLTVDPHAPIGPRTFSMRTRRGEIPSGAAVFVVSVPRIVGISVEERVPLASALSARVLRAESPRDLQSARGAHTTVASFLRLMREGQRRALGGLREFTVQTRRTISGFSLGDLVAPASSGEAIVFGVGLVGAQAIRFSGTGVTAALREPVGGDLNPVVPLQLEIGKDASWGEYPFTLTLARSGTCP